MTSSDARRATNTGWMCLVWSAIRPHDYFTWILEIAPVFIGMALLLPTHDRFRLTTLLYVLLAIHACILTIGGHFTYAEGAAVQLDTGRSRARRNHYDRVGHFAQGFIPAVLTREILLRRSPLHRGKWLNFLLIAVCLAFRVCYELIEWFAASPPVRPQLAHLVDR